MSEIFQGFLSFLSQLSVERDLTTLKMKAISFNVSLIKPETAATEVLCTLLRHASV